MGGEDARHGGIGGGAAEGSRVLQRSGLDRNELIWRETVECRRTFGRDGKCP